MGNEIERKFLVTGEFKHLAKSCAHIMQGYLSTDVARTVRVRRYGDNAFITIKGASTEDGIERMEIEVPITPDDAERLLEICLPGRIDKERYLVPYAGHTWEIDVFGGENEGLVMAEVELSSRNENVSRPPFVGQEVTGDARYYNSYLSLHPYTTWKNENT